MNYKIKKVDFEISNFTIASTNIIGSTLIVISEKSYKKYKIINYIGKGTVGQVYLIESYHDSSVCVIKISNSHCMDDLIDEVELTQSYFSKNNIVHPSYPTYYGLFKNLKAFGIIYPYFGFYNLEKIKYIDYKIDFAHNKEIIKQIINQMNQFKNIIHCDLKPSNVVIEVDNNIKATVIDFGLIKETIKPENLISTSFITSPESLLTLKFFLDCVETTENEPIQFDKHDYFGLFSIIINLFVRNSFWTLIVKYLTDINFNNDFLYKQSASTVFVYMWYRFSYKEKSHIANKSLLNIINKIEIMYPNISTKKFLDYDEFFDNYVKSFIDQETIDKSKIPDLKDFTKQIVKFDYLLRPNIDELLTHNFLIN